MPVNVMAVDQRMDFGDGGVGIFSAFTAGDHNGGADKFQTTIVTGKVSFNLATKVRLCLCQRFVNDDEDFTWSNIG